MTEKVHDLNEFLPETKTQEELKQILDEHYFGTSAAVEDELKDELPSTDDDDEIPMGNNTSSSDDDINLDDI